MIFKGSGFYLTDYKKKPEQKKQDKTVGKSDKKPEKIKKHVSFKEPIKNNFLSKLKKNIITQYSFISPDKIENNKMFFLTSLGYVKELEISKLFLKNICWKNESKFAHFSILYRVILIYLKLKMKRKPCLITK